MKDEDKAALTLTAVFGAAAVGLVLFTDSSPLCTSDLLTDARGKHQATWCFEFWLNRYQTLVGVLVAVLAAVVAWMVGMRQIRIAGRQTAAAAVEHIVVRRTVLDTALEAVNKSEASIADIQFPILRKGDAVRALDDIRDDSGVPLRSIIATSKDRTHIYIDSIKKTMEPIQELLRAPASTEGVRNLLSEQTDRINEVIDKLDGVFGVLCAVDHASYDLWPDFISTPDVMASLRSTGRENIKAKLDDAIREIDTLKLIVQRKTGLDIVGKLKDQRLSIVRLLDRTNAQIEGQEN